MQWLLADDRVASTLPNIYEEAQLIEFAKAPDCPPLTSDEMEKIAELYAENFGVEREEPKFKGTMELPAAAEAAAESSGASMTAGSSIATASLGDDAFAPNPSSSSTGSAFLLAARLVGVASCFVVL